MDQYQETFETWDKLAQLYQDKFMDLDNYNASYDFICNTLSEAQTKVLEIGCGPGNITKYLLNKRPDLKVLATDVAPNMVALAKANNPSAEFAVLDSRQLHEIKTKYDALLAGFCIPYLSTEDCKKLIADASVLINQNGLLYLSFVEGDPQHSGFQTGSSGDRAYFYFHDLNTIEKLCTDRHFKTLQIFKIPYTKSNQSTEVHTVLIAQHS
jgi:cyclopropane fatty-acyl-phospholipid synthase-like methyltransferase